MDTTAHDNHHTSMTPLLTSGILPYYYVGTFAGAPDPSSHLPGTRVWFTDRPGSKGGEFMCRESHLVGSPTVNIWDKVGYTPIYEAPYASIVSNYDANLYEGCMARATEGPVGFDVMARNSRWLPAHGHIALDQLNGLTLVKAPTINANASGTANGATTVATAIPNYIRKGYFYVPANCLHASAQPSAGFYYGEMADSINITFYNNSYTPTLADYPIEPAIKVPFSGAVPGGAGVTTTIPFFITEVPAGLLGEYGSVKLDMIGETNNSNREHALHVAFDGSAVVSENNASVTSFACSQVIHNTAYNRQRLMTLFTRASTTAATIVSTVDTSVAVPITLSFSTSDSSLDWMTCTYISCLVEASV